MQVIGYIQFPKETELSEIRESLKEHIKLTREESGCVRFEVTENQKITGRFDVIEKFESKQAFEQHQLRTQQSAWAQISHKAQRHYHIE